MKVNAGGVKTKVETFCVSEAVRGLTDRHLIIQEREYPKFTEKNVSKAA